MVRTRELTLLGTVALAALAVPLWFSLLDYQSKYSCTGPARVVPAGEGELLGAGSGALLYLKVEA